VLPAPGEVIDGFELYLVIMAVFLVTAALAISLHASNRLWLFLIAPWLILAACTSHWVWDLGNNIMRALAILGPLTAIALVDGRGKRTRRDQIAQEATT
jgi:hypothetical protein